MASASASWTRYQNAQAIVAPSADPHLPTGNLCKGSSKLVEPEVAFVQLGVLSRGLQSVQEIEFGIADGSRKDERTCFRGHVRKVRSRSTLLVKGS